MDDKKTEYKYVIGFRDEGYRLSRIERFTLDEAKEYVDVNKYGLPLVIYKLVPVEETNRGSQ